MTGDQHEPGPGATAGLLDHARELLAAGAAYLRARLALAGIETKEAAIHFGIIIALCAGAVGVLIFGYLFLCIALTLLIAQWLGIAPGWVILGLAILHFLVAVTAVFIAVVRIKIPVFSATLDELRKDQQWLSRK